MARKQQEKSQQTKVELLESAIALFDQKGFVATTISEITKNAGYAKGNFYRYWKSKDDMFLSIMKGRLEDYRNLREIPLKNAKSFDEIMNVIWDFLETMIDDSNWSKIFLEFSIYASRNDDLKGKMNQSMYRLSNIMFEDIVSPFNTGDYSTKKIGSLVTAIFEGFLIQRLLGSNDLTKEDLKLAIITLASITTKKPEKKKSA